MTGYSAVVLAAGFGKRLRPLTDHVPKALAPLFAVPLIDYTLARLAALRPRPGVVGVNLHHLPDPLVRHLEDGRRFGLRLHFSYESPEILGTGGALRQMEDTLRGRPFFVLNGDVYFDAPLARLARASGESPGAVGVVGLSRDPGRPELSLVATDPRAERVLAIGERPRPAPPDAPRWVFAGAHLATPALFDYLPDSGFACVVRDGYLRAMERRGAGEPAALRAVPFPRAEWHDLGTPATYLRAHFRLFSVLPDVVRGLPTWACRERGPGLHIAPGARISNRAIVRPPVVIDDGARIEGRAAVGPQAVIGRNATVRAGSSVVRSVVWEAVEVKGDFDRAVLSRAVTILTDE